MVLAELEVFHSRFFTPTRRVALGRQNLPMQRGGGAGGLLLAGIVARFLPEISEDIEAEFLVLLDRLDRGDRVPQPQCRHRFQTDLVGLVPSRHTIVADGLGVDFVFEEQRGTPVQHLLGAAYATHAIEPLARPAVFAALRLAVQWRGPLDGSLVGALSGGERALRDLPAGSMKARNGLLWALAVLDLTQAGGALPTERQVQEAFRAGVRRAHPDHGAQAREAAARIADLSDARRILFESRSRQP